MSKYDFGVEKVHRVSNGDVNGRCPGCGGVSTAILGTVNFQGASQDVTQCYGCMRVFSRADGGIASLLDEAETKMPGGAPVGFTRSESTNIVNQVPAQHDTNTRLDSIKNATEGAGYKMDNMVSAIHSLTNAVTQLLNQNKELMEKLATDPLVGIKKAVSEFNLE